MHLRSSVKKQKGLGLPLAIFIITVMAFIAVAINELSVTGAKSISVNALSMRAFYAAESGANIFLAERTTNPPCTGSSTFTVPSANLEEGLAQCSAEVVCNETGSTYTIESTGVCGSGVDAATRIIRVVVE